MTDVKEETFPTLLPIDREVATPVWQQIEEQLLDAINDGRLAGGQRLPSAQDLAGHIRANRHTVRRALMSLERNGYVRTEVGRGSFVQERPCLFAVDRRSDIASCLRARGKRVHREPLSSTIRHPPNTVVLGLGLNAGAQACRVNYLTMVDDRPLEFAHAWFPLQRFPDIHRSANRHRSIEAVLADYGVDGVHRLQTRVMSVMPTPSVAEALQQSHKRPVLSVHFLHADQRGKPLFYGISQFAGERMQLVFDPPA